MVKRHFLIYFLIACATLLISAQEKTPPENPTDDVRQALLGAWVLLGAPDSEMKPESESYLKFWGERHWCISASDPRTGKIVYHHGGTYTLDGDNYEETFTFANEETQHMIGITLKFKIKIDGDIYIQEGINNKYTQKWKRLTAE